MKFRLRKANLQWSDSLARYAERRLRSGLDRFQDNVRSVAVRLSDVNGPRRSLDDKRCSVAVELSGGPTVVVKSNSHCAYRAVDDVVDRVKRAVGDRIRRRRDRVRLRSE